ncbi:MAG: DUF4160 domain-containing protein [Chitinophagales bacterium]
MLRNSHFFYSNEHEPIHVHGEYSGQESKAEILVIDGEIEEIRIVAIKGKYPLTGKQLKNFRKFVVEYAEQIVEKWISFFVDNEKIETEIITRRI